MFEAPRPRRQPLQPMQRAALPVAALAVAGLAAPLNADG